MSSLIKPGKVSNALLKNNAILVISVRNHWMKDYKPGPFPETKEERAAAAEKYGLPLSDYKPYPDDGQGRGDYPDLPLISIETRDPFYAWDNPELRRNFNEPLHAEYDLIRQDRYNVNAELRRPLWFLIAQFVIVMSGSFGLYYYFEQFKMFHPAIPKQYPGKGKVHFTFEPEEKKKK